MTNVWNILKNDFVAFSFSQKTQTLADQAWERAHETGQAKDTLEMENARLQLSLEEIQRSESSLLTVCALLAGALWPAFGRIRALASQRRILSEYVRTLESLRDKTNTLGEMLSHEMEAEKREKDTPQSKKRSLRDGRCPVLVFRVGVIAVIAANRLRHFGSFSLKLFVSSESPGEFGGMSIVCCGQMSRKAEFRGGYLTIFESFFCAALENSLYLEGDHKNTFLGEIGRVKELIINHEGKKWRGLKKI